MYLSHDAQHNLMKSIILQLKEASDTKGHWCCPICDKECHTNEDHDSSCDLKAAFVYVDAVATDDFDISDCSTEPWE